MMKKMFLPALLAVAALAAACGGGGGGGSSAGGGSPVVPAQSKVAVKLVLHVPSKIGQMTPKLRQRLNEAQSTQGLNVVVYPNPQGTSTPAASQAFDVSANNVAACGTPNPDNSRTCNFTINLAPGAYLANLSSYDATPAPGGPAGTPLGIGSSTFTVAAGAANTIPVMINGIAQSISVSLPVPVVRTLSPLTQQMAVSVLDPDKNVIVTNEYVDTSGNPVTVSLSAAPSIGLITLAPSAFSIPLPNGATVAYDPTNITAGGMTGGAFTITAALSSPVVIGTTSLIVPPALQTVSIAAPAVGITNDGVNVWVAEPAGGAGPGGALQPYAPGGGSTDTQTPMPLWTNSPIGPSPKPNDVFYASDGNLYFTIQNASAVGRIPPSGNKFFEAGVSTTHTAQSLTTDGTNIWWLESGLVGSAPKSNFTGPGLVETGAVGMGQITAGTGSLSGVWWTGYTAADAVYYEGGPGGAITSFGTPTTPSHPLGIVQVASAMWFTEHTSSKLGVTLALPPSAPTEVAIPPSALYGTINPDYIVAGPDSNLWFDSASQDVIVRFDPNTSAFSYFPMPSGSQLGQMTVLNGTIWIVDTATGRIFGVTP